MHNWHVKPEPFRAVGGLIYDNWLEVEWEMVLFFF